MTMAACFAAASVSSSRPEEAKSSSNCRTRRTVFVAQQNAQREADGPERILGEW